LLVLGGCLLAACSPLASGTGQPKRAGGTSGQAPAAAGRTLTYVALGASDGAGIGTEDPAEDNWPTVLSVELGSRIHLINLGIPGATVADAQRMELPVALSAHPDLVTVWLAVNDYVDGVPLGTYTQELGALLGELRHGTHARLFVGDLPDLTLLPYFSADDPVALRQTVRDWDAATAAVCAAQGAHLVDLGAQWSDLAEHPEYISADGLHPSTVGALALAEVFDSAILSAGAG
jgi:lysophospholipase L1-like esterase